MMKIGPALTQRMGTALVITPQLRQAIKLMQLSAVELEAEIQAFTESNPLLEIVEPGNDGAENGNEGQADAPDGEWDGVDARAADDRPADDFGGTDADRHETADALNAGSRNEMDDFADNDSGPSADDAGQMAAAEPAEVDAPTADSDWSESIPQELSADADWDDVFTPEPLIGREEHEFGEDRDSTAESLCDHLRWQLNLTPMSDRDRGIALVIIDAIDETGFLTSSLDDLLATVNAAQAGPQAAAQANGTGDSQANGGSASVDVATSTVAQHGVSPPAVSAAATTATGADVALAADTLAELTAADPPDAESDALIGADEIEAVLHRIQQFDPPGVGARDLRECLLVQLRQLAPGTRRRLDAMDIVDQHIELLAGRNMAQLSRSTGLDENGLREVLALIRTLNPRPGSGFDAAPAEYVEPDVLVRKVNGRWQVELNAASSPRLRIVHEYLAYIDDRATKPARDAAAYVTEKHREAKYFMAGLKHRNETLFKVAVKIVEFQRAFLDYGPEALKPLVLRDIANEVGVHEATVSRVTRRKYMHTPRGVFELKYFFGGHVGTTDGGVVASKAVHERIRAVLLSESPRKPLSDQDIVVALKAEGIDVARRTVTKYRKAMGIPASTDRRRLA